MYKKRRERANFDIYITVIQNLFVNDLHIVVTFELTSICFGTKQITGMRTILGAKIPDSSAVQSSFQSSSRNWDDMDILHSHLD